MPRWMNRASGPTYSPTFVRNAITSCRTSSSIASIRFTSNVAFERMTATASAGITPCCAWASHARISISSQIR